MDYKGKEKLFHLRYKHLEVWPLDDGMICVMYKDCELKEAGSVVLKTEFGRGRTFDEACEDYYQKISGKILVFRTLDGKREEVQVL